MKHRKLIAKLLTVVMCAWSVAAHAATPSPICDAIAAFANASDDAAGHVITLTTYWGGKQVGDHFVISESNCDIHHYEAARPLCATLMQHWATEFANANVLKIARCIAPSSAKSIYNHINESSIDIFGDAKLWANPNMRAGLSYRANTSEGSSTMDIYFNRIDP